MKSTSSSCIEVLLAVAYGWYERGWVHAELRRFDESVRARGGSRRTGKRHMRDAAGRGGGLDLIVLLETLQPVPEAYASAEQDRDHHDVHVVDEPGTKEVADDGGASADPYVLAVRSLAGGLERVGRRSVEEGERGAAL